MSTERIADEIKFAYRVPNVSGGLVTSDIEQRTDWNYEYNKKLAQTAENNGFEYALSQVRYEASASASANLARYWRDARTHTLHDATRWKLQHIGRYTLSGTLPPRHGQL